jgi:MOSC domain-containing protein YiiM
MIVTSTNISSGEALVHKGESIPTGFIKRPVRSGLQLTPSGVQHDTVVDTRVHGGADKACYVYGSNHYPFWKELYPKAPWEMGFFGENVSIDHICEADIYLGDLYRLGQALVQISQPRQPCFKLGVRLENLKAIAQFREAKRCGFYLRVLEPGPVMIGDALTLVEHQSQLSILDAFHLLFHGGAPEEFHEALKCPHLPQSCREDLQASLEKLSRS